MCFVYFTRFFVLCDLVDSGVLYFGSSVSFCWGVVGSMVGFFLGFLWGGFYDFFFGRGGHGFILWPWTLGIITVCWAFQAPSLPSFFVFRLGDL